MTEAERDELNLLRERVCRQHARGEQPSDDDLTRLTELYEAASVAYRARLERERVAAEGAASNAPT